MPDKVKRDLARRLRSCATPGDGVARRALIFHVWFEHRVSPETDSPIGSDAPAGGARRHPLFEAAKSFAARIRQPQIFST